MNPDLYDYDNPVCPHGYRGFCPFCTPVEKTPESIGFPLSRSPQKHSGAMVIPIVGLAVAVAAFGAVIIWLAF